MHGSDEPTWVRETLEFWFSELRQSDWWKKSETVDAQIRARFLPLHEQLVASEGVDLTGPRPLLAAVIVLDQFSRNMFRNTRRAYAADPIARRLARQAISRDFDAAMQPEERLFLYLPFEHSEDRADQALAVELISKLNSDSWTSYARAHQAIIDRFGRFPHRNAVLGRESTPEEVEALQDPKNSF